MTAPHNRLQLSLNRRCHSGAGRNVADGHEDPAGGLGRHRLAVEERLLLDLVATCKPNTVLSVGIALKEQAIGLRHAINEIRTLLHLPPLIG